jgi:hypothetical protein
MAFIYFDYFFPRIIALAPPLALIVSLPSGMKTPSAGVTGQGAKVHRPESHGLELPAAKRDPPGPPPASYLGQPKTSSSHRITTEGGWWPINGTSAAKKAQCTAEGELSKKEGSHDLAR